MCINCSDINLIKSFHNPAAYLNCIEYISKLVDEGRFNIISKTCDFNKVKNDSGVWSDDIIAHVIQCAKCGLYYTCSIDTYHGRGSFRKGK